MFGPCPLTLRFQFIIRFHFIFQHLESVIVECGPPQAGTARGGNDVERRGLVVQESFEDELPYVPTTLPQERSLALPMVPVRERGDVRVARVERPRPPHPHVPQVTTKQGLHRPTASTGERGLERAPGGADLAFKKSCGHNS